MDEKSRQTYETEREMYFQRLKLALISAISSGELDSVLRGFAEEYAEVKLERDQLATKINQLIAQITWHFDESLIDYQKSKSKRGEISKQLNEIASNGNISYPAAVWVNMTKPIDEIILENANILEKTPKSRHADILIDAMPDLNRIIGRTKLSAWWDARNFVTSLAIGHSDDPKMICYEILRELRGRGEASIETVSRLQSNWIREILTRSVTPEKLHQGINHAYRFKNQQRLNQGQYAVMHQKAVGSESNLRLYIGYLKTIEELAKHIPDDVKAAIDASFDE
ncbi:MAG: hypothetical protein ABI970_06650 [Chloroflexota bacterium]|nr:hypothetical protein [Anaerolineae bacterium]